MTSQQPVSFLLKQPNKRLTMASGQDEIVAPPRMPRKDATRKRISSFNEESGGDNGGTPNREKNNSHLNTNEASRNNPIHPAHDIIKQGMWPDQGLESTKSGSSGGHHPRHDQRTEASWRSLNFENVSDRGDDKVFTRAELPDSTVCSTPVSSKESLRPARISEKANSNRNMTCPTSSEEEMNEPPSERDLGAYFEIGSWSWCLACFLFLVVLLSLIANITGMSLCFYPLPTYFTGAMDPSEKSYSLDHSERHEPWKFLMKNNPCEKRMCYRLSYWSEPRRSDRETNCP